MHRLDATRHRLRVVNLNLLQALHQVDGPELNLTLLPARYDDIPGGDDGVGHLVAPAHVRRQLVPFEQVEASVLRPNDGGIGTREAAAQHGLDLTPLGEQRLPRHERRGAPEHQVLHAARHHVVLERRPRHADDLLGRTLG